MLYPQTPIPDVPIQVEREHNTLITELKNGIEYRRKFRFRERRLINLTYRFRKKEELQPIYNFYTERSGAFEDFIFEFPYSDNYVKEYIGRGDGVNTTFTLPFKDYISLDVYFDGSQVATSSYSIDTSSERATITFNTAPAQDTLITCDFIGQARLKVRFNDRLQTIYNRAEFVDLQVSLIEVLD